MLNIATVISLIKQYGGADPAVIEAKVQDWLDAHPEATTTVQDGSITEQKLATSIAQKLGLISSLSDEIAALPFSAEYENLPITWERTDQYINDRGNVTTANYFYQFTIDVTPGERFLLDGANNYGKAIYATLDTDGNPVRHPRTANDNSEVKNIEITIASNETKLILQASANDRAKYAIKKYIGMALNANTVGAANLKTEIANILPETSFVNLFNPNDTDVVAGNYIDRSGVLHEQEIFNVSGYIPIEINVEYQFPVYANYFGDSQVIYVPFFNIDKTYSSFATGSYDPNTQLVTVTFTSVNARYTRINFAKINSYLVNTVNHNPEVMMFTKAPYPAVFIQYGDQSYFKENVFLNVQNMQNSNPLFRKSAIFLGDSICNGGSANDALNGWAGRIGRENQMLWRNMGISGATFTAGLTGSAGVISEQPISNPAYTGDPDYIIIEGGTNDADIIGSILGETKPTAFGSFNLSDYNADFANTTYCGAIESLLKTAITTRKGAKIGVIIAPKMGQLNATYTDYTTEHYNRRAYFETLMQICRKWGVPYLNLWDECYLNPMLPAHYTQGKQYMYTDGQHLTSNGYDYITPIIENWMKTL